MTRSKSVISIILTIFLLQGCAFFSSGKVLRIEVRKHAAIDVAKKFAAAEGFSDEFYVHKPSSLKRRLSFSDPQHWIWQVYFSAKGEPAMKFYKKTYLLVEINSVDGSVEQWGRR